MKILSPLLLLPWLLACSSSLEDYQGTQPAFDLKGFFDRPMAAHGIVQDYSRKLTRRFCVDIIPSWQGNNGSLDETFYFADGEVQKRLWQLQITTDGQVTGNAGDVVGQASGRAVGNAFNWQYVLTVPIGDNQYNFAIDDWLYAMDKERVFNRSYMKKLGITVAEISIFFDKNQLPCQA